MPSDNELWYCPLCPHSGRPAGRQRPPLCGACAARSGGRWAVAMEPMPPKVGKPRPYCWAGADEVREKVALLLAEYGALTTSDLVRCVAVSRGNVELSLAGHPWFYRHQRTWRWHLTPEGEMWVRMHRPAIATQEGQG